MDIELSPTDDPGLEMDYGSSPDDNPGMTTDTEPPVNYVNPGVNLEHDPALHAEASVQSSSLCINCCVDTRRLKRHTLNQVERTLHTIIGQWVSPSRVSDNSPICDDCLIVIRTHQLNLSNQGQQLGHSTVCVNCGRSLNRRCRSHKLQTDEGERDTLIKNIISEWVMPHQLRSSDMICHPCWLRAIRAIRRFSQPSTSTSSDTPANNVNFTPEATIFLPNYTRVQTLSQQTCFYPGCNGSERLCVPTFLRKHLFSEFNFYVPPMSRICLYHITNTFGDILTNVENPTHIFTAAQIEDFADLLKSSYTNTINFQDVENMDSAVFHYWIGLSHEQVMEIIEQVPRIGRMHKGKIALLAYLMKLRTGDSDKRMSSLLKIPRSTLERLMGKARSILNEDFVPQHLGLNHISRTDIISKNLLIPNALFAGDERKPILIVDGTYLYVQKSSNYSYQKNTYSLHKYRNLVKPLLIVCTDGYIVDVLGPYPATTSDAQIMIKAFDETNSLRQYFQEGDVFILDRGFRDSVPLLEDCNYVVHMPSILEQGETQLSTLEANKSRCVTICRWVVEVVNGIFKHSFKLFRQEYFNNATKHIMIDFSIAASIINMFHPRIRDRVDAGLIIENINRFMFVHNGLADFVQANQLNRRRAEFVSINVGRENLTEFPQLTYNELILFACGTYQLKQARSYYGEHRRSQGYYTIEVCGERDNSLLEGFPSAINGMLIRARIKSRHISRKIYYIYIIINKLERGLEAIRHYCCNCIVGRRTVGCCAHVITIVWYLGWARYENVFPPAQFLDDVLIIYNNE